MLGSVIRVALLLLCLGSCGNITRKQDDAGVRDDAPRDSAPPDDAPVDATSAPRKGVDITNAAGRVTGGGFTVDVQLGHPIPQRPVTGGGFTVEGGAAIKP